jgi:hypothetical protein
VALVSALTIFLAAAASATGDLELGLRADTRSSTLAPVGAAGQSVGESRAAGSVSGRASGLVDTFAALLTGAYGVQLSTLDLGALRTPAVSQDVGARLRTHGDGPLRGEASIAATRARTEPLTDVSKVAASGGAQVLTTGVVDSESLSGGARGELVRDRTTVSVAASANVARGVDSASGQQFPTQRGLEVDAAVRRDVTERDKLGVSLGASRTVTAASAGSATSAVAAATGTWERQLTPTTAGSLGAGVAVAREEQLVPTGASGSVDRVLPARLGISPAADLNIDHLTARLKLHGFTRLSMFVDRFTGSTNPMASAGCAVSWNAGEAVALAVSASGGARIDGVSSFGALDAHAAWKISPRLDLEGGVLARTQYDRRTQAPSFVEAGVYVAVAYGTGSLLGAGAR